MNLITPLSHSIIHRGMSDESLLEPHHNGGKGHHCSIVESPFFIAGGNAPPLVELDDAALDHLASAVALHIEREGTPWPTMPLCHHPRRRTRFPHRIGSAGECRRVLPVWGHLPCSCNETPNLCRVSQRGECSNIRPLRMGFTVPWGTCRIMKAW